MNQQLRRSHLSLRRYSFSGVFEERPPRSTISWKHSEFNTPREAEGRRSSSLVTEHSMRNPRAVLHWYDFLCPFCYIGQSRNAVLVQHGFHLVELTFQRYKRRSNNRPRNAG